VRGGRRLWRHRAGEEGVRGLHVRFRGVGTSDDGSPGETGAGAALGEKGRGGAEEDGGGCVEIRAAAQASVKQNKRRPSTFIPS
jgi:hypothetical protein